MRALSFVYVLIPFLSFIPGTFSSYINKSLSFLVTLTVSSLALSWFLLLTSWGNAILIGIVLEALVLMFLIQNQSLHTRKKSTELILNEGKSEQAKYVTYGNLILFSIIAIYSLLVIRNGEWTWDAANAHEPVALAIFQESSIRNIIEVSPWQAHPSAAALYMANFLYIYPVNQMMQIAMIPFLVFFIYFVTSWINEAHSNANISLPARNVLLLSVWICPPLFFTFGTGYIDFYSQSILLFLISYTARILSAGRLTTFDSFVFGILLAGVLSSKLSTSYQGIALLIFLAIKILFENKAKFLPQLGKFLLIPILMSLGLVFQVRNYLDYSNPFYPYKDVLGTNFEKYIFTNNEIQSFLQGSASPLVSATGNIYSVFWNQIGNIFIWIEQHFQLAIQVLTGEGADLSNLFKFGAVYALDARITGNGIIAHLLFAASFIFLLNRYFSGTKSKNDGLMWILLLMLLLVPGPTSGRYNWAVTFAFIILGTISISKIIVPRKAIVFILCISFVSGLGTLVYSQKYISENSQIVDTLSDRMAKQAVYNAKSDYFELFSKPCPDIQVMRNLRSESAFATVFWLNGPCTKVSTYKENKKSDYLAIVEDMNYDPEASCSRVLPERRLTMVDRWGQSSVYFIISKEFDPKTMGACLR
jgi:hypothetical protein